MIQHDEGGSEVGDRGGGLKFIMLRDPDFSDRKLWWTQSRGIDITELSVYFRNLFALMESFSINCLLSELTNVIA
ncbi:hypothetical protein Bca4012_002111 [Brassica carinata]